MATILRGIDNFNSSDYINYPSIYASYNLLGGNLSVDTSVLTSGFSTTLYTGNGTTQSINTGVDMSTQWGNTTDETYGGLVWTKSRSNAFGHYINDTVRGIGNYLDTSTTGASASSAIGYTAFTSTGFNIGNLGGMNTNLATYASWNFQTTHKKTGTTNHGKTYTEHYNPYTGFTIVKYEGSGLAGHEIPHHLGRKLGFATFKNLTSADYWKVATEYGSGFLEQAGALSNSWGVSAIASQYGVVLPFFNIFPNDMNYSSQQYIMYGWANSYIDESGKLIGNYEIGVYQGTGVAGNKVTTRGKPAWIMVKRLDSTGNWRIYDTLRNNFDNVLYPNLSNAEGIVGDFDIQVDGFTCITSSADTNASGGQYLYMVVYDNDSGSGRSKYPKSSDTANVQISNALIPLAHGTDTKGNKNTIMVANETITGVTYTDGKNYLYKTDTGYGVKNIAPNYGRINPANGGDFYNILQNKWYTSAGIEIAESRNYMNHIVHADADGGVLYVEELPKIEYKNVIKAEEYLGKNACTAWVNFDGTTTPPTIRDSYNVGAVIRTATGAFDIYYQEAMDNIGYAVSASVDGAYSSAVNNGLGTLNNINKCTILTANGSNALTNFINTSVTIFGGKN